MEERVKLKKRLKVAISKNLGVDFTDGDSINNLNNLNNYI